MEVAVRRIGLIAVAAVAFVAGCAQGVAPVTSVPSPAIVQPSSSSSPETGYPWHTNIVGSMFYVGEKAGPDNNDQTNEGSAWCGVWTQCFGGVDDPNHRTADGYWPARFTPKENVFYVALPCDEFTDKGYQLTFEDFADQIPWVPQGTDGKPQLPGVSSVLKNHWIEISVGGRSVFAQWEDTGPFEESGDVNNDCGYVFGRGDPRPANTWDLKAGIDLSPAVMMALTGSASTGRVVVAWRFVEDEGTVPNGPWSQTVTTSAPYWP
jgi:hypothetical protein